MEFSEVVRRRRMVRSFDGRPVPRETVEQVLRDGQRGPSAGFSQGQAFVVLEDAADRDRFWARVPASEGVRRAPVVVVVLTSKQAYLQRYALPDKYGAGLDVETGWPVPYWDVDTGMAVMLLLLSAVDAGLGALFFGIFRGADELLAELGVPPEYHAVGAVAMGFPAPGEQSQPSLKAGRKPAEDVVRWGHW
jgi:nitroreductase